MIPLAWIDRASSSRASSRNRVRGWYGLGSSRSMSLCSGPEEAIGAGPGGVGALVTPVAGAGMPTGRFPSPSWTGTCGSGSRMSAPSPRPNAFLGISNYLLSQLRITLCTLAVYIIENNRLTKARRLRQTHVPRNQALKHLRTEETTQVRGYLPRQGRAFVIHG